MPQMIDFTKYIVPQKLNNNGGGWVLDEETLDTTDLIYLHSWNEVKDLTNEERKTTATDHALDNFAWQSGSYNKNGKPTVASWLRSANSKSGPYCVSDDGSRGGSSVSFHASAVRPALSLNLESLISAQSAVAPDFSDIVFEKDGKHFLQIGEYPKTAVDAELFETLEGLYNGGTLQKGLACTGRLFTTNGQREYCEDYLSREIPEFEYEGVRYVRDIVRRNDSAHEYENGRGVLPTNSVSWKRVEPITFEITNWQNSWSMEETIQQRGLLRRKQTENPNFWARHELKLDADEAILAGLPFYPDYNHDNCSLWQNSLVRCFLQSAKSEELDGNIDAKAPLQWDFRGRGFLHEALNMTREATKVFVIPEYEKEIAPFAFCGCVGLEQVVLHDGIKKIGESAFDGTALKYVYFPKDGKTTILSKTIDENLEKTSIRRDYTYDNVKIVFNPNHKRNFIQLNVWKDEKKIKFIPPEYTMQVFPSSEMMKYFVNNNNQRWGKLVKTLGFDTLEGTEKNNSLTDLMKIYYAIGGFSENQGESEKAYEYILKYVAVLKDKDGVSRTGTAQEIGAEIHARFSKLVLKGPYNPTFAQFFMKYYGDNPDFMSFRLKDKDGDWMDVADYLCQAHNSFGTILKIYPNRVVNGNEERALLTPKFVAEHSAIVEYENVEEGNELLAETVGKFGYSQDQFDRIQEIYNKAKTIKDKFVIQADKALGKNGITFRILEKDDPLGFVIGDITNCCQHIDGAADSCVDDGYTNPEAGFIVFEKSELDENGNPTGETRILGQAYIWYDPETNTVCFDNIEIPTKVLHELRSGDKHEDGLSTKALMQVVVESANAIMQKMNEQGIQVDRVTTGEGYNDLKRELSENFTRESNPKAQHRNYSGYSDAKDAQYIIATYDQRTKETAGRIRNILVEAQKDLGEIGTSIHSPILGG